MKAEVRHIIEEDDAFAGSNEPADGLMQVIGEPLLTKRIHPIGPGGGQDQSVDVPVC